MGSGTNSTILIVLGTMGLFFLLENLFPLRRQRHSLGHRLLVNVVFSACTYLSAAFIMRPVALAALGWGGSASVGVLHWISLPPIWSFVAGFLLLDLSFYYWHRLNHVIPWLWRFHNVHHSDPDMDTSTGFRFHFGEIIISTVFRGIQLLFIGVTLETFLTFELIFQLATYFHHSNLRLPAAADRALNLVLVTPRMHTIHHSQVREETDSNYSVIFSLWDRINRTFRRGIPVKEISIGVPGYSAAPDNRIFAMLKAPFVSQRDYWKGNLVRRSHDRAR